MDPRGPIRLEIREAVLPQQEQSGFLHTVQL